MRLAPPLSIGTPDPHSLNQVYLSQLEQPMDNSGAFSGITAFKKKKKINLSPFKEVLWLVFNRAQMIELTLPIMVYVKEAIIQFISTALDNALKTCLIYIVHTTKRRTCNNEGPSPFSQPLHLGVALSKTKFQLFV